MERRYGDDKTIHRTGHVDVEVDDGGTVVAVWFRCQPLPFRQNNTNRQRATDMHRMYDEGSFGSLKAVVLDESE